jgi:hypothetical protein
MPAHPTLSPIAEQPLSVVLLADGGADLPPLVAAWVAFLDARKQRYEIVLVAPGPAGPSPVDPRPGLRVVHADGGEGAALRAGVAEARNPLLFYSPCRPEYPPEFLGLLLDRPAAGPAKGQEIDLVHVLSGFRAGVPMPVVLRVLGWVNRLVFRILLSYSPPRWPGWLGWRRAGGWLLCRVLFGLRHHDVASPVRLLRREIFAHIPVGSDSAFAHVEVLAKANFLTCLMGEEVPLPVVPPPYRGDARRLGRDGWKMLNHPDFGPPPAPPAAPGAGS